jgi:dTDP-4-dehydrorhamnose 3,5-epimerase
MVINGVEIKRLTQYYDSRGWFCENIRACDPFFVGFGQWSDSLMHTGVIKAWHIHQIQYDYWRIPIGVVRVVLCDLRKDSTTYRTIDEYVIGGSGYDPCIIKIPPGVAHGCKVLQGPALLSYITSHIYNPNDEGRIPHDDKQIGYDWFKEEIK